MDLFTLKATIQLDTTDYERKIADVIKSANEAGEEIEKAVSGGGTSGTGSGANATVAQATKDVSSFGTTVKSILASQLVQKTVSAVSDIGKEAVQTASDLVEVQNVIDQTFGSSAATINAWAKTSAQDFGLSELQAKQFTGYLGAMLQTSGIDQAQSAEMAKNLAGLAGDIASFYNIGIEEAYQKIQSGMAGEREPLLRYGLDLGADAVSEYAGIKLSELSNAERYQARYDYLMDATKTIQGDFARTENEFANASRTLENNANRALAAMGEKVLPIVTAGTNAANDLFDALLSESPEESLASIDAAMADTVSGIEQSSSAARAMAAVLGDFGDKSALTAEQQKQWEAVASELVRTIPELGSQIDMQTGEIEGGTQALEENISAWEEAGKAAAQTSALEAKKSMLDEIGSEIASEQGLFAAAQKEMEQHADDAAAMGAMIAQRLGEEFDGTAEGFRAMMDSVEAYAAAESLGFSDAEIADVLSGYDSASEKADEHQKKIALLQEEYSAAQSGIGESTSSMQSSVGALEGTVTESFDSIGTATDALISSFDQSSAAYTNAYNTGIGAANGLNDAYGTYAAAVNAYGIKAAGIGLGGGSSIADVPGFATGLDYVPHDDYLARLHEGEAVLTKSDASHWRNGETGTSTPQEIAGAVAQAVAPLYDAISNIRIVMDKRAVGNAVTQIVSENIARDARSRRNSI